MQDSWEFTDSKPEFKEKYFSQILDHFNYNSLGNGTYLQRYLITGKCSVSVFVFQPVFQLIALFVILKITPKSVMCGLSFRSVLEERLWAHLFLHWQ